MGDDDKKRKTVILFHGNSLSLDSWKKTKSLEELSSKGYKVFAIDLPAGKGSMSDKLSPRVLKNDPDRIVNVFDKLFEALDVGTHPLRSSTTARQRPSPRKSVNLSRRRARKKQKLSGLDIPVLLVWGDRDRIFSLEECGRILKAADCKGSRTRRVPGKA